MSLPGYRFFSVVVLSVIFLFFSCASSGPVVTETITSSEENDTSSETPVVSLYVPETTDRGFLTFDNETILQDLEMGTPESLQNAATFKPNVFGVIFITRRFRLHLGQINQPFSTGSILSHTGELCKTRLFFCEKVCLTAFNS